jgi:hypothetical protein
MRKLPIFGTFISFPTEVLRVGKNIAKMAIKEKDVPRMIGMSAATAGTFGGAYAYNYAEGVAPEEQAALREFAAPWEKNGQLFITDIDGEDISFINASYTDPWSYISDPTRALFQGLSKGDVDGAFKDATWELFQPYFSEGLFVQKVVDVSRNKKKENGAPVYNEEDSYENKFFKSAEHIAETLVPPLTPVLGSQAQRLERSFRKELTETGRRDLLAQEAMNMTVGLRKRTINKKEAVKWAGLRIERRVQEANRIINEGLRETSTVQDLKEKYRDMENSRKQIFEDFQYKVKAARTLGLSNEEIKNELVKSTNLSQSMIEDWMAGDYTPYKPGSERMKRIQEKLGIDGTGGKTKRKKRRSKKKKRKGQTPLEQLIGAE